MKKISLSILLLVICVFGFSCSDSAQKKTGTETTSSSDFCKKITSSSNSNLKNTGIKTLIEDICEKGDQSKIDSNMYTGTNKAKVIKKDEDATTGDNNDQYRIYLQGGLSLSSVPASVYFEMMRLQARGELKSKLGESKYSYNKSVDYKVTSKSDSKIKYHYTKHNEDNDGTKTDVSYAGIANFVTIETDSLYVVTNLLDDSDKFGEGEVSRMYSISIITQNDEGSKVYAAMTQTANNHGQGGDCIKKSQEYFTDDMEYSYKNAINYNNL